MSVVAAASAGLVLAVLAVLAYGPEALAAARRRLSGGGPAVPPAPDWDPGRELRAERRARDLLGSVVSAVDAAMYDELGFISLPGRGEEGSGYAYLIYPHLPVVAYDSSSGELLNEYCVEFPDRAEAAEGGRLPNSDDVLAKWMSLQGDEREVIGIANMHVPGRRIDPARVRRDLARLREWRAARRNPSEAPSAAVADR